MAATLRLGVGPKQGDQLVARQPVGADGQVGGQLRRAPRGQRRFAVPVAPARHAEQQHPVLHAA